MARHRLKVAVAAACLAVASPWLGLAPSAGASQRGGEPCSPGAHTLSPPGSHVYPETGNGGYTSLHTLVHLVYDSATNTLPARQPGGAHRPRHEVPDQLQPRLRAAVCQHRVRARTCVCVRSAWTAVPARWSFVQPTYPGDPNGQNDPNPAAHEASQANPVGGPRHNPLPPACSPELLPSDTKNSLNGTPCPANKLVITPQAPLPHGARFTVRVSYTGRPGVHNDGDGTTEGWFRARGGGFVTTEPVGSEDWMPLNDYPAAKPTYDFADTVTAGRTVIANGVLVSVRHHPADAEFPGGSVTWRWHAAAPIASYLVEDSIGNYRLTERTVRGMRVYEAQDASISAAQRQKNRAIMRMQPTDHQIREPLHRAVPVHLGGDHRRHARLPASTRRWRR